MTLPNPTPRLYFAYGSNLSLHQMKIRCPTSTFHSLGLLKNYKWMISSRGYANVVSSPSSTSNGDVVEGMLYVLEEDDEKRLDRAEGVPFSYEKFELDVEDLRKQKGGEREGERKEQREREVVKALVYVGLKMVEEGVCKREYVARMNRGIRDAREEGMTEWYVRNVLRKWVPEEQLPNDDDEVEDPFAPEDGGRS